MTLRKLALCLLVAVGCGDGSTTTTTTTTDSGAMATDAATAKDAASDGAPDAPAVSTDGPAVDAGADTAAADAPIASDAPVDADAPPVDAAPTPDLPPDAPATPTTDMEWCQRACGKLVDCGVQLNSSCATVCMGSPTLVTCIKAAPNECNALALCRFKKDSAASCGGEAAGTPAGTGTCAAAATCADQCNYSGQNLSCNCDCWAKMAASKALLLLARSECAIRQCPGTCASTYTPACEDCYTKKCGAERTACDTN